MGEINIVILSGTVVRPPEFSQPKTYELAKFTIAHKKDPSKDFVTYHEIRAWAKTCEKVKKYALQGTKVMIQGRLDKEPVESQKNGQKTYYHDVIVASDVQPMDDGNQEPQAPTQQPDFMQNPQDNPPPEHTLPPKRTNQEPEPPEGRIVYSSTWNKPKKGPEQVPDTALTTANANGGWTPPANSEPPF